MKWEEGEKGFRDFLKLEKALSMNSIVAYLNDVKKFTMFMSENYPGITPDKVTLTHLKAFVETILNRGISPRTQARTISVLRSFFKYLLRERVIKGDPSALLDSPKVGRKLPDVLTIEEVDMIIDSVDVAKPEGRRNRAILEVLYSCGLRVSELVNLKMTNLFFDEGYIKVEGKGNKERLVPVSSKAVDEVNQYINNYRVNLRISPDSANILFLNRRGQKLSRVMIFTIISNLARQTGLKKRISPHTFRHSFATHLVSGGADLRAVQEMLGHESILTTEIYTHLDRDYLKSTIKLFHPRS